MLETGGVISLERAQEVQTSAQLQAEQQACETQEFIERNHHILLVDDDPITLRAVEQLLKKHGYKVSTALNGREALKLLEATKTSPNAAPIDLVLTDVLMPEVSGFELIHEVVHGTAFSDLPVVVMSSQDSQESVLQAFEAGAADYLIKPIRRNEVATLWQHVWRAHRFKSAHPSHAATGTGNDVTPDGGTHTHVVDAAGNLVPQGHAVDLLQAAGTNKNGSSGASTSLVDPDQGSTMVTSNMLPVTMHGHPHLHANLAGASGAPGGSSQAAVRAVHARGEYSTQTGASRRGGAMAGAPHAVANGQSELPPSSSGAQEQEQGQAGEGQGREQGRQHSTSTASTSQTSQEDNDGFNRATSPASLAPHDISQIGLDLGVDAGGAVARLRGLAAQFHAPAAKPSPCMPSPAPSAQPSSQPAPQEPAQQQQQQQAGHAMQQGPVVCLPDPPPAAQEAWHATANGAFSAPHRAHVSRPQPEKSMSSVSSGGAAGHHGSTLAGALPLALAELAALGQARQAQLEQQRSTHVSMPAATSRTVPAGSSEAAAGSQEGSKAAPGGLRSQSSMDRAVSVLGHSDRSAFSALTVILPRRMPSSTMPSGTSTNHLSNLGSVPAFDAQPSTSVVTTGANGSSHHLPSMAAPSANGSGGSAAGHGTSAPAPAASAPAPAPAAPVLGAPTAIVTSPSAAAGQKAPTPAAAAPGPAPSAANGSSAPAPSVSSPTNMGPMGMAPASGVPAMGMPPHHPAMYLPEPVLQLIYALSSARPPFDPSMHGPPPPPMGPGPMQPGSMDHMAAGSHPGAPPMPPVFPNVVVMSGQPMPGAMPLMRSSAAAAHRQAALAKYLQKKKNRNFEKKVRYESRKRLAEARPRVRGQFVKQDVLQAQKAAAAEATASASAGRGGDSGSKGGSHTGPDTQDPGSTARTHSSPAQDGGPPSKRARTYTTSRLRNAATMEHEEDENDEVMSEDMSEESVDEP
mmetsp:Transcript_33317/g.84420  ORF Transcript_33317/g.84420 Transcript_33317/m.84420 type:complete len:970 (-) Transcript_33317:1490-4399(-)|eukprot:CAMPEP_0202863554 /NCGR_PEP_ID=MMETSP1391-20130828/4143_1 /ASSEMBLY_ACC=CAM_ASM_000867 /TAXON_ID=1034604 /ORGANISM="Chlamydomonas leiostraca, Strain SAG 11-49" /LENGTH=969 /DNA_ID=CAMNT_0049543201 /DNA_START=132 /DNA_END=3041 /DNA_ORIENTATION=-